MIMTLTGMSIAVVPATVRDVRYQPQYGMDGRPLTGLLMLFNRIMALFVRCSRRVEGYGFGTTRPSLARKRSSERMNIELRIRTHTGKYQPLYLADSMSWSRGANTCACPLYDAHPPPWTEEVEHVAMSYISSVDLY
jgi:hypothetical protein